MNPLKNGYSVYSASTTTLNIIGQRCCDAPEPVPVLHKKGNSRSRNN
ncbi:hypothetical protein [Mucilaginibacter sp. AK015]|nr:hypothetical protein [Mucilaginibacter sp. AK015]MBB5397222.1 hypothetical protein [Mucilaginibacter sp. AK015]